MEIGNIFICCWIFFTYRNETTCTVSSSNWQCRYAKIRFIWIGWHKIGQYNNKCQDHFDAETFPSCQSWCVCDSCLQIALISRYRYAANGKEMLKGLNVRSLKRYAKYSFFLFEKGHERKQMPLDFEFNNVKANSEQLRIVAICGFRSYRDTCFWHEMDDE